MSRLLSHLMVICILVASTMSFAGCEDKPEVEKLVGSDMASQKVGESESAGEASTPEHPAGQRAAKFLEALKYGDIQTAAKLHVESTSDGFYCGNQTFRSVMEKARDKRSEKACADIETVAGPALRQVDDPARLLVQIMSVVCENPEADCADYGRRVLESHADAWPEWTRDVDSYVVARTIDGKQGTLVYVDIERSTSTDTEHRTLEMTNIDGEWYVAEALLSNRSAAASSPSPVRGSNSPDFD